MSRTRRRARTRAAAVRSTAGVTGPGGIDIPWEEIRGVRVGALPVKHGADVVEVAGI
ncbi:hypothetical protein [Georgenia sp. Z1491]|uniref:hypothetical protein n=1 Tax=Georgenia sp. Z1491 TaxID=3416707 RepID=UPI003CE784D4